MSEADYAGLVAAAHHELAAPAGRHLGQQLLHQVIHS